MKWVKVSNDTALVNLFCIVFYFYMNTRNNSIQNNLFFEALEIKFSVKDFLSKCDQTTVYCVLTLTEIVNEKLNLLCCEDLCD